MLNLDKKIKVFLLVPNFRSEKKSIMNVRFRQPLSMAIIAELLRQAGHDIKLLDANALDYSAEQVLSSVNDFQADILVVTTSPLDRWECPHSRISGILKLIDRITVKHKVVVGSHGTTMPEWIFKNCQADFVVRGEPELAVKQLVDALAENQPITAIKGLSYLRGDEIVNNPSERISDLDALPLPAYDLLPMDRYSSNDFARPFSIVLTSRGCPFNCTFCLKAMMPGPYIIRSIDKVIEEIEYLISNFQIKSIYFQDWEFFVDSGRAERICNAIIAKNLKFNWGANARAADVVRLRDLMPLFRRAGCVEINLGLESAADKVLKKINKQLTQHDLQQAVGILKASGIRGNYYMLLNAPGENPATIKETVGFIFRNKLRVRPFLFPIPYPGTILFQQLKEHFPRRLIDWGNIEDYAGTVEAALSPWQARLYLQHCKKVSAYGNWYLLRPAFWREVAAGILKIVRP